MTPLDVRRLVGKLGDLCKKEFEAAIRLAMLRGHYNTELEHLILKLVDSSESDFSICLKHFGVDTGRLSGDLNRALEPLKKGNTRAPALAQQLVTLLNESWTVASVTFDSDDR
jgi:type VI secretion system protein VasG